MVSEEKLSNYYAQRILPSAVVRSMFLLLDASFNDRNIIRGFECYNLILLVAASLVWKRIADNFSISLGGRWIGFCGLFLSYMCSKQTFYYPVFTDVTALFVGLLALLFYVEKRPFALLARTIVGAFAWQIVSICGALLLIFPRTDLPRKVIAPTIYTYTIDSVKISRLIKFGWIVLLILSIAGVVCLTHAEKDIMWLAYSLGTCSLVASSQLENILQRGAKAGAWFYGSRGLKLVLGTCNGAAFCDLCMAFLCVVS